MMQRHLSQSIREYLSVSEVSKHFLGPLHAQYSIINSKISHTYITFINVCVEVAVFLAVSSNLSVIVVDQDAHLCKQLHLLFIQIIHVNLRHPYRCTEPSDLTANTEHTHTHTLILNHAS